LPREPRKFKGLFFNINRGIVNRKMKRAAPYQGMKHRAGSVDEKPDDRRLESKKAGIPQPEADKTRLGINSTVN
jgi:hypothetical protein